MRTLIAGLLAAGALVAPAASVATASPLDALSHTAAPARGSTVEARLTKLDRAPLRGNSWAHGSVTIGHSLHGRPIDLREWGANRDGRRILAFGCIHGTECAASAIPTFQYGCPTPGAVFYVPNLNPDGLALGTRLNGRGVDLNRNFPASWEPIGTRWDLQYSGPRPFSERETRLAAQADPSHPSGRDDLVPPGGRADGSSVWTERSGGTRLARHLRFVRYTDLPFRHLPWLAGTAPNWQNHTFPGTASFVVELPLGADAPIGRPSNWCCRRAVWPTGRRGTPEGSQSVLNRCRATRAFAGRWSCRGLRLAAAGLGEEIHLAADGSTESVAVPLRSARAASPSKALDRRRERRWIKAAQGGSEEALEHLYRRHWPWAHRAAYLVVHDAAAAEDIAQEAFLAAIRSLDRFDRRRPFGPWLNRIVVNRAIDWARARSLRSETAFDPESEPAAAGRPRAARSQSPPCIPTRL